MRRQETTASTRILIAAATCACALAIASCTSAGTSGAQPGASQHTSAASQPGSPASTPATPTSPAAPVSCPGGWRTGTSTVVHHLSIPPVPVATAIRTGTHPECKFDRVVLDLRGATPGYTVSFVTKVVQDASGQTVAMPGTRFLVIRLSPAQGHVAALSPTLPTGVQVLAFPQLKAYDVTGDFEGVLTIALGLAGGTRYRTGELPGKIYLDVAW